MIVKKVKIPKIKASDNVFVQLVEQSKGDAYDRTGSVFIIPANKAQSFLDGMKMACQPYRSTKMEMARVIREW
ncbi:hypothetical protein KUH03_03790 [Sphingobacterium sp. E70]|nr:PNGase F N-terminal domain-containing protein [Sphingobacterium sp. E70]ULT26089.1 hypothetical protein KUH03_03790 [Sphingobacterium sp. E70]